MRDIPRALGAGQIQMRYSVILAGMNSNDALGLKIQKPRLWRGLKVVLGKGLEPKAPVLAKSLKNTDLVGG
jgi:hypothetical protein